MRRLLIAGNHACGETSRIVVKATSAANATVLPGASAEAGRASAIAGSAPRHHSRTVIAWDMGGNREELSALRGSGGEVAAVIAGVVPEQRAGIGIEDDADHRG